MGAEQKNEFRPDYVSPPGESLSEILESRCMTQTDLAERTGRTPKTINEIIKGKAPITAETAIQLERVLSIPASFWNNRQRRYQEFLAHQQEARSLTEKLAWLQQFPYRSMARFRWVPEETDRLEQLKCVLNFFGVASPQSWDKYWTNIIVSYRKSDKHEPDRFALAAWLRRGEKLAEEARCEAYDHDKFKKCLGEIRSFTTLSPAEFHPKIVETCASCGVFVAFVPELPRTASGATRWLSSDRALLQLSLKYKTDDHLWFTFFHEAAHILFHQKKKIFIEDSSWDSKEEEEANKFAEEFLVPPAELERLASESPISKSRICKVAESIGIAPGIIVGQLQKKRILPWTHCNDLKRKLKWVVIDKQN